MKKKDIVDTVLEISSLKSMNPVQKIALENGLLENSSMIIASPTASGKTLIAEIAALHIIKSTGKKVVYLAPLVALAREKYESFKRKYEPLGIKVALSVGGMDNDEPWLKEYDIIVCSNEKMDSLLRHRIEWARDIGLIIVDEVHLINDHGRGPTLEIVLTKLREIADVSFLALSATIKNSAEIAEWLGAKHIKSDWRPVKLFEGVCFGKKIEFNDRSETMGSGQPELEIAKSTMKKGKQAIFFVASRRLTESLAKTLSGQTFGMLEKKEQEELENISADVLNALEKPTEQCRSAAECVKHGAAFHHAGLLTKQKSLIEDGFRKGLIKFIAATPTLAMGVSMPAFRVIVRDAKRYYPRLGSVYIPVLEYKQMAGRAGRPEWDSHGESILVAKNEREAEEFWEHYIKGETEEIYSKLAVEPVLRTHVLSLVASRMCRNEKDVYDFFAKTFYAHQYKDAETINLKIREVIKKLAEWKMIRASGLDERKFTYFFETGDKIGKEAEENSLEVTVLGKRVSELYIDPKTAWQLVECMKSEKGPGMTPLVHMISSTLELSPPLKIRQSEYDDISEELEKCKDELLLKVPSEWDDTYEEFLGRFKTCMMFLFWAEEGTEDQIFERFRVSPGELRSRLELADWILYSAYELAMISNKRAFAIELKKARARIKYGVKEELLPLVKLRGIGKVRARKLYNAGIRNAGHINKTPVEKLKELVGDKTAEKMKQISEK